MPLTPRRVSRVAAGIATAGIATATLLAPTAAEAGVPLGTCTTQKAAYRAAADTYRQAKTALNDAVAARKAAVDAYKVDPTTANRETRADAIAAVTRHKGEVAGARPAVDATYAAQTTCVKPPVPSVTLTNPRVANYGNLFPIADVTYANIPDGNYFLVMSNDGVLQYRPQAVTFVAVVPRQNFDPFNPGPSISYRTNGTSVGNYLDGRGCVGTTGQTVTFALWTGSDGTNPTGTKIAEGTADNPCY